MNRAKFYQALRRSNSGVFGSSLSQRQVTAMDALLDAGEGLPISEISHVFGEVFHETQGGMYPVKETVYRHSKDKNPSDAKVIARLNAAWAKGQLTWVKRPYWRDGAFGRGGIQLTHWRNYEKLSPVVGVDLVRNPDKALDPVISARIAVEGCRLGLFTGKKLRDYAGSPYDHYSARDIVNGDRAKNGKKVAKYAMSFERALAKAGYVAKHPIRTAETLEIKQPKVSRESGGVIAAILKAIRAIFGDKK